ncbi:hypothetical protein K2173_016570 [Erythroxylum novogranatense]|uniref:Uncharacterized protein n=1 Tax=Erythroxylum novogranatense TaxID=1862640 RepID=A0AAV8SH34_9ROSI|nr:hypothetical protein K2173_016570 [Erythroxylum novogranatense]
MISILVQERILGFVLGSALTSFVVLEQRKRIRQSIADGPSQSHAQSQLIKPIFGKEFRSQFGVMWNKAVDEAFGPVIASLTSGRE